MLEYLGTTAKSMSKSALHSADGSAPQSGGGFFGKLRSAPKAQPASGTASLNVEDALQLLRNYEDSKRGWFWSTDASGNLSYISDTIGEKLGKPTSELIGTSFLDLFHPPQSEEDQQRSLRFILTKQSKFDDLALQAKADKQEIWWAVSGRPFQDSNGNFQGYRGSGLDITEQRRSAKDNSRLVAYDSLTGLLNRARMSKLLETTLSAFQNQKRPCAIMLIDLDRFKQVNDTLGHPAGDALLKQVAERLVKVVGDREKVCRLGGDEFQILLPDNDDRGALGDLGGEIIYSLSQPYSIDGSRCVIGASIGIAVSPFDGDSSEDLIRNADLALYAAKGSGRGRFRFYSATCCRWPKIGESWKKICEMPFHAAR